MALIQLLEDLATEVDHFELDGEVPQLRSNFINAVTHLPVVSHPVAAARACATAAASAAAATSGPQRPVRSGPV